MAGPLTTLHIPFKKYTVWFINMLLLPTLNLQDGIELIIDTVMTAYYVCVANLSKPSIHAFVSLCFLNQFA